MNAREFIAMILQLIHTLFTSMSRVFNQYTSKTITLNNKIFTIQKQLGEGGFSFVYLVKSTSTLSTQYAIKRIRIALPEHEQRLDSEINAHSLVQSSPYVIQLIDHQKVMHGQRCSEGLLLLPYYQLGTLQHLINTKQNISLKRILEISMDVCSGLLAFHTSTPVMAFRDLKPANIIITSTNALLIDLGSVTPAVISITNRKQALALQDECAELVTACYRAPELFDPPSECMIDERSDVWSLGCCIYAQLMGDSPFDGSATAAVNGQIQFHKAVDEGLKGIIMACLDTDIKKRPNVLQVKKDLQLIHDGLKDQNGSLV